ncbi:MAG: glycosyl transferase [Desulfobacteraceae bacterium]|nr:glycosyl transferase [Desulfobacteraceae bacterium]MBC2754901.1 glycosyl transferase [Desulfobacteraceae bacterium]
MNQLLAYSVAFLIAFGGSVLLTPLVRHIAVKYNYVAVPRVDRWHKKTTGLFGGVSIFVSMMAAWLISSAVFFQFQNYIQPLLPVALGGTAIFFLGLLDDISEINPQYKLIGQVVVASVLVIFGFQFNWFESKTANLLISIFWIVGITNAFNLLDNMDGLSAGVACISGFFLFLWLTVMPGGLTFSGPVQLILTAYIGSLLGFLFYNFNPASIFMGDAGSLFIGFTLACLTVIENPSDVQAVPLFNQLSVIAIPCLILFIPILDTAFVSFMRKLFARSIFQGGRDHSSHRMVAIGFSEKKAVLVLYLFAIISGLLALGIYPLDMGISIVIITLYLILVLLFWVYLANVEVYSRAPDSTEKRNGTLLPVLMEAGYGRTLSSILMDLLLITVAYYASYLLRFGGDIGPNFDFFLKSLPIMFACQIFCLYSFGVYQRLWWGSRLGDISVYVKGVTAGTVMAMLALLFLYRFQSFSRAVFIIYGGVMLILISFSRFFFRLMDEWVSRGNQHGKPALIYGAGIGGQMVVREIETNNEMGLSLVGFIDDDPMKKGKRIHGYPVFGSGDRLEEVINKYNIKEIIVSFREKGAEKKKDLHRMSVRNGLDITVSQMRLIISP